MGIISRPRSHPALVRAITRWYAARDADSIPLDELRNALVPEGLAQTDAGSTWDDTVRLALELGLLEMADEKVEVGAHDLRSVADDDAAFRAGLRGAVFAQDNADGLWEDVNGKWSSKGAKEFARIAVWILEQDPVDFNRRTVYDTAREAVTGPGGSKLIENAEQLRVYERWAEALGLAEVLCFGRDDELVIPDCTPAIADALASTASARWLAASTVRRTIVEDVPVLRGGRLAAGAPPGTLGDGEDGPGVRHALQRLIASDSLNTNIRSDAGSIAIGFDGNRATHLRWTRRADEGVLL